VAIAVFITISPDCPAAHAHRLRRRFGTVALRYDLSHIRKPIDRTLAGDALCSSIRKHLVELCSWYEVRFGAVACVTAGSWTTEVEV
jgi:hypothetical protein